MLGVGGGRWAVGEGRGGSDLAEVAHPVFIGNWVRLPLELPGSG